MKIKTSITLSDELIKNIDEIFGRTQNRSKFIENVLRDFIRKQTKKKRDQKDFDILNSKADTLNKEAEDVLSYQVKL